MTPASPIRETAKPPQGGFFIFGRRLIRRGGAQPFPLRDGVRCEPSLET